VRSAKPDEAFCACGIALRTFTGKALSAGEKTDLHPALILAFLSPHLFQSYCPPGIRLPAVIVLQPDNFNHYMSISRPIGH